MIILIRYATGDTYDFTNCVICVPTPTPEQLELPMITILHKYGIKMAEIMQSCVIQYIDLENNLVFNLKNRYFLPSRTWIQPTENSFENLMGNLRLISTNGSGEILFKTKINCNNLDIHEYVRAFDEIHQNI